MSPGHGKKKILSSNRKVPKIATNFMLSKKQNWRDFINVKKVKENLNNRLSDLQLSASANLGKTKNPKKQKENQKYHKLSPTYQKTKSEIFCLSVYFSRLACACTQNMPAIRVKNQGWQQKMRRHIKVVDQKWTSKRDFTQVETSFTADASKKYLLEGNLLFEKRAVGEQKF